MRRGFTLVELSIVLVIIGLLVGGILVAQSMIQTAKIVRLVRDIQQYEISINNFKQTYNYYPGDATQFKPAGNGDREIPNGNIPGDCNGIYSSDENTQAFAHLTQAGMIQAKYVPYQPQSCGGSQSDDYVGLLGGISAPNIKIKPETANVSINAAISSSNTINNDKYTLSLAKSADGNAFLPLTVDSDFVVPMENKLGATDYDPTGMGVGLQNTYGTGMCYNSDGYPAYSCSDTSHGFLAGTLYYYLTPI